MSELRQRLKHMLLGWGTVGVIYSLSDRLQGKRGVNLHLTHHVFPHWSHRYYPQLSRIIEEIAAREGLDFRRLSLTDLLSFQQRFLRRMSERPVNSGESR